ncbi:MAG: endonuclease/exonuclease/phosphatase family protein [Sediminibacterium sp.]
MFKQVSILLICAILSKSNYAEPVTSGVSMKETKTTIDTLKVLTYNVHHCNPPGKNIIDVAAIANAIKQSNASIVALQEIDVNTTRSGKELNEAEAIAKECGMYFCFGKALDYAGGGYGIAILSKYPVSEVENMLLSKEADPKTEQRALLTARLTIGKNKYIRFACTHLDVASEANRVLQVNQIIRKAVNDSIPFVIGGDFNCKTNTAPLNVFDNAFHRSCSTCEATFPQDVPVDTIDFIAFEKRAEKKLQTIKHLVIKETYASDHRPVYAELLMKN